MYLLLGEVAYAPGASVSLIVVSIRYFEPEPQGAPLRRWEQAAKSLGVRSSQAACGQRKRKRLPRSAGAPAASKMNRVEAPEQVLHGEVSQGYTTSRVRVLKRSGPGMESAARLVESIETEAQPPRILPFWLCRVGLPASRDLPRLRTLGPCAPGLRPVGMQRRR